MSFEAVGQMITETRLCPLCKAHRAAPYRIVNRIPIVQCQQCRLLYRPAIPDDLKALYDERYYREKGASEAQWAGSGDYIADKDRLLLVFDEHMADLEKTHRPGRLLDVGCAAGFLLEAARRRGWDVVGLDISDYAARYARGEFRLDVRIGTVEEVSFPDGSFDVITAFEYIEHVVDPVKTLACLRPWLRSDGLLVLTTPNAGGWEAQRHPERFQGFLEWRHLTYFSRETMRRLLRETGFVPADIRTDLSLVTRKTLAACGVAQSEQVRAMVNRLAPGAKTWIRRTVGRVCGGSAMKVYARPSSRVHSG